MALNYLTFSYVILLDDRNEKFTNYFLFVRRISVTCLLHLYLFPQCKCTQFNYIYCKHFIIPVVFDIEVCYPLERDFLPYYEKGQNKINFLYHLHPKIGIFPKHSHFRMTSLRKESFQLNIRFQRILIIFEVEPQTTYDLC